MRPCVQVATPLMTEYKQYSVNLSPSQSQKLVKAIEMKAPVTIRLKSNDLTGSDKIFLTSTQINKIKSKTQITNIRSKLGSGIRNRRSLPTTQSQRRVPQHRAPRPLPNQTGRGLRNRPKPLDYNDFAQYQPPPPFIGDWSNSDQMIKKNGSECNNEIRQ